MRLFLKKTVEFDAGHEHHGHHYAVTVTWADIEDTGVEEEVESVSREFAMRRLEEMLPASPPDPAHFAAYLLERMRSNHSSVSEVEVSVSDGTGGVARHEPR